MAQETWQVKPEKITAALSLNTLGQSRASGSGKRRKIAVIMSGGGYTIEVDNFLDQCPPDVDIILVAPQHMQEYCSRRHKPKYLWVGGTRQRRNDGPIKAFCCAIVGTVDALRLLAKERPEGVVGIGQRAAFYYLLAGKLLGMKTVYVECITRITRLSTTGRVIAWLRLADRFYVQWPEATKLYHRAEYVGRLL
jgi:UDP-N-acetylglucosamine:LPS N-acetylglucosamine transferase